MTGVRLAPSILSADFGRLAEQVREAAEAGADWIHVDVMDGHFVPNITIGPPVVAALRRVTDLPLDVHLMVQDPERMVEAFRDAGADHLTVQAEATVHLHRAVERIRELGMRPGVALNPGTPLAALEEILPYVDIVLIMSVNPGAGGQRYIPTSTGKIARARRMIDARGLWGVELEVDGGVSVETVPEIVGAGASVVVAGSAVFSGEASVAENVAALRRATGAGPAGGTA